MFQNNCVIRDLYLSDVVLMDEEFDMMGQVDDSYFDKMEELVERIDNEKLILEAKEFHELEKAFNDFYFEYGFVQFKRGLELGLSMRQIH